MSLLKLMILDFLGNKNNKQWLIYAYHRETGEIVAYVWGKET
jgi:IS1 family transposase